MINNYVINNSMCALSLWIVYVVYHLACIFNTLKIYKAFLKIRNVKSRLSSSPNLSTELSTTKIFFFFYSGLIKHTQLSRHPITAQFLNYCYTTLKAPSLNTVEANELLSLSKVCRWRHLLEQILHEPKTNEMLQNISSKQVGR